MQRARQQREARTSQWPKRLDLGGRFQDRAARELQHISNVENTVTQGSHLRSRRSWVKIGGKVSSKKELKRLADSRAKEEARRALGERVYRTGRGDRREAQFFTRQYGAARRSFNAAGRAGKIGTGVAIGGGLAALAAGTGAELTRRRGQAPKTRPWQNTRTRIDTKAEGDRLRSIWSPKSRPAPARTAEQNALVERWGGEVRKPPRKRIIVQAGRRPEGADSWIKEGPEMYAGDPRYANAKFYEGRS